MMQETVRQALSQKERLAAWQDANQNGLFPRIKKGAGGGTEPDETP